MLASLVSEPAKSLAVYILYRMPVIWPEATHQVSEDHSSANSSCVVASSTAPATMIASQAAAAAAVVNASPGNTALDDQQGHEYKTVSS